MGFEYILQELDHAAEAETQPIGFAHGPAVAGDLIYAFAEGVYDSTISQLMDFYNLNNSIKLLLELLSNGISQAVSASHNAGSLIQQIIAVVVDFFLTVLLSDAVGVWPRAVQRRIGLLHDSLYDTWGAPSRARNARLVRLFEPSVTNMFTGMVDYIVRRIGGDGGLADSGL